MAFVIMVVFRIGILILLNIFYYILMSRVIKIQPSLPASRMYKVSHHR